MEKNSDQIEMQYAGAIAMLCECHLQLPESFEADELRESILSAVNDWCDVTGWGYKQTLNRIDLMPPREKSKPVQP
jgi:hypothetical protein